MNEEMIIRLVAYSISYFCVLFPFAWFLYKGLYKVMAHIVIDIYHTVKEIFSRAKNKHNATE